MFVGARSFRERGVSVKLIGAAVAAFIEEGTGLVESEERAAVDIITRRVFSWHCAGGCDGVGISFFGDRENRPGEIGYARVLGLWFIYSFRGRAASVALMLIIVLCRGNGKMG